MTPEERFADLELRRRELENELQLVVEQMHGDQAKCKTSIENRGGGLEREIMERWAASGTEQVKVKGLTLYVRSELIGTAAESPDHLCDAFEASGLGDMVKTRREVNFQTLRGFLNEQEKDDDGYPILPTQELQEAVDVKQKMTLRTRKA
jgi:hypothetical protein